jgi:hypothetical protein
MSSNSNSHSTVPTKSSDTFYEYELNTEVHDCTEADLHTLKSSSGFDESNEFVDE